MGIYDTLTMLKAIEQIPNEPNFFVDMFTKDLGVVDDETAIWDYMKGGQHMAPFVVPGTGGVELPRDGFVTRQIEFPVIAPERIVDDQMIKTRAFGEVLHGGMTPAQRALKIQARDLKELKASINRRKGWMVRQVLLNGKLDILRYVKGGREAETTMVADFGFTNNYVPATAWGQVGSNIHSDLNAIMDLVEDGGGRVDQIVMDGDSAEAMLADDKFTKLLDIRNVHIGEIEQRYMGGGMRYMGMTGDGVRFYSCRGKFVDDDGLKKDVLPRGTVIAGSNETLKIAYGPVTLVDKTGADGKFVTYMDKEVPQRIASEESGSIVNRVTSRPVVVPFNVDGWAVAKVL